MKIMHIPFCFYPDPVGGTEIYVDGLVRALARLGVEGVVAAPSGKEQVYVHQSIRVRRVAVSEKLTARQLYGQGDVTAAAGFARVMDDERPDVVHFHALTSAVSLRVLEEAEKRNIPVVYTFHTPTAVCQRGTLMRWGSEICDGKMRLFTCARCTLHGLGVPLLATAALGSLPPPLSGALMGLPLPSDARTGLGMTHLLQIHHASTREFLSRVSHVVAVADWVRKALLINGVALSKITVSRHGLPTDQGPTDELIRAKKEGSKKIVFFGRLDRNKGIEVLIGALRVRPTLEIQLDIYGVAQRDAAGYAYRDRLVAASAPDPRITFHDSIPASEVVSRLAGYDALVVPSQWLETGPLVVLEARAAGVPVIGSDLGGISELVRSAEDGVLVVDYRSPEAWARVLEKFCATSRVPRRVRPTLRTMDNVAVEMKAVYERVLSLEVRAR